MSADRSAVIYRGLIAVAVAAMLAGCAAARTVTVVQVPPTQSTPVAGVTRGPLGTEFTPRYSPATSPNSCMIHNGRGPAELVFASSTVKTSSACQTFIQTAAADGALWDQGGETTAPNSNLKLVCYLRAPAVGITASVFDGTGDTYGDHVCASLLGTGTWTEARARATTCRSASGAVLTAPPGYPCD